MRLLQGSAGFTISQRKSFFFTYSHFFGITLPFGIFCLVWYEKGIPWAEAALGGAGEGLG